MFLTRRPSAKAIERFVHSSANLPLSYGPPGLVRNSSAGYRFDESLIRIGHRMTVCAFCQWAARRDAYMIYITARMRNSN